ncbi:hypothetical protein ACTXGQ_16735 [Marinobacter sp. 1Y8]
MMTVFLRWPLLVLKGSVLALGLMFAGVAAAEESEVLTIDGTLIRGDQEMPTVMYLVPWQPPEVQGLERPDEKLMVRTTIAPLERSEFQRMLSYHRQFEALHAPLDEDEPSDK